MRYWSIISWVANKATNMPDNERYNVNSDRKIKVFNRKKENEEASNKVKNLM